MCVGSWLNPNRAAEKFHRRLSLPPPLTVLPKHDSSLPSSGEMLPGEGKAHLKLTQFPKNLPIGLRCLLAFSGSCLFFSFYVAFNSLWKEHHFGGSVISQKLSWFLSLLH